MARAKAKKKTVVRLDKRSNARTGLGSMITGDKGRRMLRIFNKKVSIIRAALPKYVIEGNFLQELLASSFEEAGCVVIRYSSHSPGADLNVDGKDVSVKTGQIDKQGNLSFSCSRLQTYLRDGGIDAACEHLDNIDPDFFTFFTALKDKKGETYYKLIVISGKSFSFKEVEWKGFDERGFIIPNGPKVCKFTGNGIKGNINLSTSAQLRMTIDTNIHKPVFEQEIYPKNTQPKKSA